MAGRVTDYPDATIIHMPSSDAGFANPAFRRFARRDLRQPAPVGKQDGCGRHPVAFLRPLYDQVSTAGGRSINKKNPADFSAGSDIS